MVDFSGYVAVDEVYDGPFCIVTAVDAVRGRRLAYELFDATLDIEAAVVFLRRLGNRIRRHGKHLSGITADGSQTWEIAAQETFGSAVAYQVCRFHVISTFNRAALDTVARTRKALRKSTPHIPWGCRRGARFYRLLHRKRQFEKRIRHLFYDRSLFVKHHLTEVERRKLRWMTRGLPHLRRLREAVEDVYRLYDRRCSRYRAQRRLQALRRRTSGDKTLGRASRKLASDVFDKSLAFLNDPQLPSTSNTVERSNRRFRKMQKSVYRVRAKSHIEGRIALDMQREVHGQTQQSVLKLLGSQRSAR